MGSEHVSLDVLSEVISGHRHADVRLVVRHLDGDWRLEHADVTLNAISVPKQRFWRYPDHAFIATRLPGPTAAGLLAGAPQQIEGMSITANEPSGNALFERLPSHRPWTPVTLPWPISEWTVGRVAHANSGNAHPLVGDGPSFLDADAAFTAFIAGAPRSPGSPTAGQSPLWRVRLIHADAYLHRMTVAPDALTVAVKGTAVAGTALQLSSATSDITRSVGTRQRVRFPLPRGLAEASLLVLRRGDELLDYRYFTYPAPGGTSDPSVIWEEPGTGLHMLINAGEGLHVEFKEQLPADNTNEAKRTMLKTVVAFASGEGGTVLFGVADDGTVAGLDPATIDRQRGRLVAMIRDLIVPAPPYRVRVESIDGRVVMVLEVDAGRQGGYALFPDKPEFYVRRGATTYRARVQEISAFYDGPRPRSALYATG